MYRRSSMEKSNTHKKYEIEFIQGEVNKTIKYGKH